MEGKFFKLDYVPNKLVYVHEVSKGEINFLVFFGKDEGLRAVKHRVHVKSKADFKKVKNDFSKMTGIQEAIEETLKPKTLF